MMGSPQEDCTASVYGFEKFLYRDRNHSRNSATTITKYNKKFFKTFLHTDGSESYR